MFQIIKYIQPTWYFNLKPSKDWGYFPFDDDYSSGMDSDSNGFSSTANINNRAYNLHKKGFKNNYENKGFDWWGFSKLTIKDEYIFARQNYNPGRIIMACFIRILFFHNPFKEAYGLLSTTYIKRKSKSKFYELPDGYVQHENKTALDKPLITVVIPTLNRYKYLNDVLTDLEVQDYPHFEVIVIDQSEPFNDAFYQNRKLNLRVIRQREKALWLARNTAIRSSESAFLLFYDDDSRVNTDWISQHLKCIDYFKADISSGISLSETDKSIPENYKYFKWSDQLDTGNVMIKRTVFEKSGLFDRQFEKQRMGDGEFGLRTYLLGFKNISNPLASRIHLKVGSGGLREMGNWDAYRPKSIWSPRPIPSVLYFFRKYFGNKATMISIIINTPSSIVPYKFKRNKLALTIGFMIGIIILPIIIIQIMRSWLISSRMLRGPKIEMP